MRRILVLIFIAPLMGAVNISTPGSSSREIVIGGVADGKAASYKNSLWIEADADVASLAIIPTELKGPGGPIQISSIHVNAPGGLQRNVPRELGISVDTALAQGDFTGTLALSIPADSSSAIDPIAITLRLRPKPNVVTIPAAFNFKTVRCATTLTCGFAEFLLPKGLALGVLPWRLSNQTPASIDWMWGAAALRGDRTGDFIDVSVSTASTDKPPVAAALQLPFALPAHMPKDAAFSVDRSAIRADHYQGQYRIEMRGADPLSVPFTLDVRDGPLLPLVVLVLGIALGRLIQSTNTPRAQAQIRLLDKYHIVATAVHGLGTAPVRNSLELRLGQTLVDIRKMSQSEADISNQLDVISRLAADSDKLDLVEPQIQRVPDAPVKAQLLGLLSSARTAIAGADYVTAERILVSINNLLTAPPGNIPLAAGEVAGARPAPGVSAAKASFLLKSLSWLSGADPLTGDWFYSYGRPLMFLLLLILLAFTGLYNSYIRNATFGSEGYFDYLSLFLWGISADVAQKTIQNLSLTRNT